jgi:glycerol-3-phosphate dehydrogenase (NAD(P)+)
MLGKGKKLQEILDHMGMVVEGVRTAEAAYTLSKKEHVEMPITVEIFNVLFEGKDPKEAVDELMGRDKKDEIAAIYNSLPDRRPEEREQ